MGEITGLIETIVFLILILSLVSLQPLNRHVERRRFRESLQKMQEKQETKESLDAFTHVHTEHWEYIQSVVPWRTRLRLSRFRGKKWALKWRIKLFSLFHGFGPKVAQWVLDEYMITAKVEDQPPSPNSWICLHCGVYNEDTALFCKNCGEYK